MTNIDNLFKSTKSKKLLAIFPHPDDETMLAGNLLLYAKKQGFKTSLLTLTQGGAGQMHIHPKGKTIKQVRKAELLKASKVLKLDNLTILDFDDGKLKVQKKRWLRRVETEIAKIKPGIIVTFDHSGWTGHPDHIITSILIKDLIANKFPKINLLWPTPNLDKTKNWIHQGVVGNIVEPTYIVSAPWLWITKYNAARIYKSQRFGNKLSNPLIKIVHKIKNEYYAQVDFQKDYKYNFVEFDI